MRPPQMRTRTCVGCGSEFTYRVLTGVKRTYCNRACQQAAKAKARHEKRVAATRQCSTPHCGGRVVFRVVAGLCEACYCFQRRTGQQRDPRPKPYKLTTRGDGYLVTAAPGHPMAGKKNRIAVHRMVAYDVRVGVCDPCHWCGVALDWERAHVDHLNDNKGDNAPANLVLSCPLCNKQRGMALSFLRTLRPERVEQVMVQVNALLLQAVRAGHSVRTRKQMASGQA